MKGRINYLGWTEDEVEKARRMLRRRSPESVASYMGMSIDRVRAIKANTTNIRPSALNGDTLDVSKPLDDSEQRAKGRVDAATASAALRDRIFALQAKENNFVRR